MAVMEITRWWRLNGLNSKQDLFWRCGNAGILSGDCRRRTDKVDKDSGYV